MIERWTGPPVDTHTYLIYDAPGGEGWVVDAPLDTAPRVLGRVEQLGLRLARLILTHGHFDHILGAADYVAAGIPVAAHPLEEVILAAPQAELFGLPYPMPELRIDEPLEEGATLRLGESVWRVWHVPGHAPGHLALYCAEQGALIGGDLLFQGGYGRVDLPGTNPEEMAASLARLLDLPPETRVYPGHGPETTLAREAPWLRQLLG